MIKTSSILFFLIILSVFTALRNISPLYYLLIFSLIIILLLKSKIPNLVINRNFGASLGFFLIFIFITFYTIIWSGIYWSSWQFLAGVPRILLMLIFVFLLISYFNNENQFIYVLKILLFCYVIAGLTIFYQIYFGQISWFSQSAGRAGMVRYSSILGSLTIYGSIVGYGFLLATSETLNMKNNIVKFLIIIILFLGSIFCLSKSAIGMFFLSTIIYLLFYMGSIFKYLKKINKNILILLPIFLLIFILLNNSFISSYYNASVTHLLGANNLISNSDNVLLDSPSISLKIITDRLFYWINAMLNFYGTSALFTGVGLQGAGGTLGLYGGGSYGTYGVITEYATAHNAFGDLLFIGGFLYLISFICLLISVQYILLKNYYSPICKIFFLMNIIFIANMCFASGSIFHPAISFPFWLSVSYIIKINMNNIK